MASLSSQRLEALSKALLTTHAVEDRSRAARLFADACTLAIPCANASFNQIRRDAAGIAVARSRGVQVPPAEETPLLRNLHEHRPIVELLQGRREVLALADFYPRRSFHQTSLYNEYYRRSDTQQQLCFPVARQEEALVMMAVNHVSGGSFAEEDRLMADLLRRHLAVAWRRLGRIEQWKRMSATACELANSTRTAGIVLDREGRPTHLTPAAIRLLETYLPMEDSRSQQLPEPLARWVSKRLRRSVNGSLVHETGQPLILDGHTGRLEITFRPPSETVLPLLLLHEHPRPAGPESLQTLGLTARQAEVLYWIAEGKSNSEVATILSASPRTIQKHAENLYARLGVENRHAATLRAREILDRRPEA